ncbi:CRISPR-associated helicase/endonuclease Cas3 [Tepiditoga spiralis]|uniref:CRISPR-associated helicase/endonuclease Cas3 n=1 Tax=Tepiditoga spiralis TaxID=2108365 RepID=A0A7G1G1D5_9BACT|nr:CRISPR-associated helicase Cas3' [Tepiditoga spiralis]BBE29970.1 CRISPR-associated helicase/endonuclease Cas3 [Tepiditoga spiralis]
MIEFYYAKSNPKETIEEHTEKLLDNLNLLKEIYPNIKNIDWDILYVICKYHDLGKINPKFQTKIGNYIEDNFKDMKEIPHNFLSPCFLPKKKIKKLLESKNYNEQEINKYLIIIYQSIYWHHEREEPENLINLFKDYKEEIQNLIKDYIFAIDKEKLKFNPSIGRFVSKPIENQIEDYGEDILYEYILHKGLLNKIDYSASAGLPIEISPEPLSDYVIKFLKKEYNSNLNDLQEYMKANENKNIVVIASTGYGKTEAGLLWIGKNKGYFTLPVKVSINSIYRRLLNKIKLKKEKVGLLHSDTLSELLKDASSYKFDEDYYNLTKNKSLPLTITTLDQIIKFIFKYNGYEYDLAHLSYSKIIIDEIQMYNSKMLAYLIIALKYIDKIGGKFSIITATFPPFIYDLMKNYNINIELSENMFLSNKKRHKIKVFKEDILNLKINKSKEKVLIIANTIKKSQEIYDLISKSEEYSEYNIELLHSRFINKDRKEKEDLIIKVGNKQKNGKYIFISTSIVEASLDIDFDILYTELLDLNSLFQRMGRCYRKRELKEGFNNVNIFIGNEKNSPSGTNIKEFIDREIFEYSKEEIFKYDNKYISEEDKQKMIKSIFNTEKLKETEYFKNIKNYLNYWNEIEKGSVEKKYINLREIDNCTIIPKTIYNKYSDIIEEKYSKITNLKKDYENKKRFIEINNLIEDIKKYSVNIPSYMIKSNNIKLNLVENIEINKYKKLYILNYDYSKEKGIGKYLGKVEEDNFI